MITQVPSEDLHIIWDQVEPFIKKALDDLVKNRPQINLDSEAARIQIAEYVTHCIKK